MERSDQEKLAKLIRYYILISTSAAGSGHATSALSSVELMVTLYFKYLHADLQHPDNPVNDRVIFSKGHATPLLYSLYAAAGRLSQEDLLQYRTFESNLEGHPTTRFPFTEAATGSLGQGLSVGVGEALALWKGSETFFTAARAEASLNEIPLPESDVSRTASQAGLQVAEKNVSFSLPRVFVLLGDGEMAEGEVWEAMAYASFKKLTNLIAIIDVNRLGQSQETMYEYQTEVYRRKLEAFGWGTIVVDGHNLAEIDAAYRKALDYQDGPVAIIAKTIKGKGVSFLEDKNGWHGKALSKEELGKALAELGEVDKTIRGTVAMPVAEVANENLDVSSVSLAKSIPFSPSIPSRSQSEAPQNFVGSPQPSYDNKPIATRKAFGNALVRTAPFYPAMLVLDGDVKNSTYTELFAEKFPDRFLESFIAEQNMVGMALGLSRRGFAPWVSTFSCFFTRAFDQIRMASITGATIRFNGSHAGVSIGADGPSQMGLEDLALFRSIHGSTVLYPADPFATERLVEEMMKTKGISYIRTNRPETPVIYTKDDAFPIGGSKVFYSSMVSEKFTGSSQLSASNNNDVATVVAAGVTLHEALAAQKELAKEGVGIRVIDCYSVKPIDAATLKKAAAETKAIIVVEDHYPEGGLGEAVKSALSDYPHPPIIHLAVSKLPRSGKLEELLHFEGIDRTSIIETVHRISSHVLPHEKILPKRDSLTQIKSS